MNSYISPSQYQKLFTHDTTVILEICSTKFDHSIEGLNEQINFLNYCANRLKPAKIENNPDWLDYKMIEGEMNFRKNFIQLLMSGKVALQDFSRFSIEDNEDRNHWIDSPYYRLLEIMDSKFTDYEIEKQVLFLERWISFLESAIDRVPEIEYEILDLRAEVDARKKGDMSNFLPNKKIKWTKSLQDLYLNCKKLAQMEDTSVAVQFRRATKTYLVRKKNKKSSSTSEEEWVPVSEKQLTNARDRYNNLKN